MRFCSGMETRSTTLISEIAEGMMADGRICWWSGPRNASLIWTVLSRCWRYNFVENSFAFVANQFILGNVSSWLWAFNRTPTQHHLGSLFKLLLYFDGANRRICLWVYHHWIRFSWGACETCLLQSPPSLELLQASASPLISTACARRLRSCDPCGML